MRRLVADAGLDKEIVLDSAGLIDYHEGEPADGRMRAHAARRGVERAERLAAPSILVLEVPPLAARAPGALHLVAALDGGAELIPHLGERGSEQLGELLLAGVGDHGRSLRPGSDRSHYPMGAPGPAARPV